jgi:hypothetical protein
VTLPGKPVTPWGSNVATVHPANCEIRDRTIDSALPLSSDPIGPASIMSAAKSSFNPRIVVKSRWPPCFRGGIVGPLAGLIFRTAASNTTACVTMTTVQEAMAARSRVSASK